MENRTETIEELNDVLEKNYDSIAGYRNAAENAEDSSLISFFNQQVVNRERFVDELSKEVTSLGGTPKTSGSVAGSFHRAWIDFKTALSFEKNEDVIEACITGEKNCIDEYDDLLEETHIPDSTRSILTSQKAEIETTLTALRELETVYDS